MTEQRKVGVIYLHYALLLMVAYLVQLDINAQHNVRLGMLLCNGHEVPLLARNHDGVAIAPRCGGQLLIAKLYDQGWCGGGHAWGVRAIGTKFSQRFCSDPETDITQTDPAQMPSLEKAGSHWVARFSSKENMQ